jgi:hypothetical protein
VLAGGCPAIMAGAARGGGFVHDSWI